MVLLKRVCASKEKYITHALVLRDWGIFYCKKRSKLEVKINIQNNQNFNAIFDEMCLSNDRDFFNTQYA